MFWNGRAATFNNLHYTIQLNVVRVIDQHCHLAFSRLLNNKTNKTIISVTLCNMKTNNTLQSSTIV